MNKRLITAGIAFVAGCVFILLLAVALSRNAFLSSTLLDRPIDGSASAFPFTIQSSMWIMFFIGGGELFLRWRATVNEKIQLGKKFLPEDEQTLLQPQDLGPIIKRIRDDGNAASYYLQRLIKRVILQFQTTRSVDQASSLMNSSIELYQHEVDMKYNMLKYVVWLIPTLGFIGTIVGISLALEEAGNMPSMTVAAIADPGAEDPMKLWIKTLTGELAVAFNTTLIALILSAILVFFLHIVQEAEEMSLNRVGQYCMDNLISRLYVK